MYNSRTHVIASNINVMSSYLWFCIHLSYSDICQYQAKPRKRERNKLTLPDQVGIGSVLRQAHSSEKKTYKVLLKRHIRERKSHHVKHQKNFSNKKNDNKLTSNGVYKYHQAGRGWLFSCWREGVVCFVRTGSVFQFYISAFLSNIRT